MTKLMALVGLVMLAGGCSAAGDYTMWTTPVELEDAPHRPVDQAQQVRFTPHPDAAADLELAFERWEAAGVAPGQLIVIDQGGIPAKYVDSCVPWPDGSCKQAGFTGRGIEVFEGTHEPLDWVWTHEVGHAMGLPHLETGVMWRDNTIDELTLEAVCVLLYCDGWAPEGVAVAP